MIVPSASLDELYSDCRWAEGPIWFGDMNCLLWSDIPNQRILRWLPDSGVSTFRQPSNFANGNTRDREGRLVSCEHGGRRVTRTEVDGSITVIADSYQGKKLNAPNDVIVRSDGSIWFTDPTYGIMADYEGYKAEPEQPTRNVYRFDPESNELTAVITDFEQPNGLAFSPDETRLFVADSAYSHDETAPRHIRVFDVADNGKRVTGGKVFCTIDNGLPDGFRLDTAGNLWSSAGDGVHCFSPEGELLGKIRTPQTVANITFGGPRRNRLFIAATKSLYAIYLTVTGAQHP
ncbi:SMP-30/gluconolactonase/LRE family protein [Brucella gallinifaecis]|uniref:SMP-30/gluconolactonase/LRE family protein n=1 Tax=Brucella gallinifaecis TaxID=215590 RepID=A0A502BSJ6_9HYPH|nr:SMP-30/gluconolactonase/LRE family protein [Brucella gallinifaecis]TPF77195.1 SMP-30/gluconolactonase/LRE family protein [Brucella gallinifaecis]